jgi:predicted  nucleic acid-binding Zn-ribbon protein
MDLEGRLKATSKDAARIEGLKRDNAELEDERDGLLERVDQMTYLYRVLYRASAPREDLERASEEVTVERGWRRALETRCATYEERQAVALEMLQDVREQLTICREERDGLSAALDVILAERRACASQQASFAPTADTDITPLPTPDYLPLLDAALTHLSLSSIHSSSLTAALIDSLTSLRADHDASRASTTDAQSALIAVRTELRAVQERLAAAEEAHAGCAEQIFQWQGEAKRAGVMEARLRSELADARVAMADMEGLMGRERELLRRANDASGRSGAAREALEDEVAR